LTSIPVLKIVKAQKAARWPEVKVNVFSSPAHFTQPEIIAHALALITEPSSEI